MITALFDGRCIICQSSRHIIKSLDYFNQVEFLDLHNKVIVESRYPQLDHKAMMGELHVLADNTIYAGFPATRRILKSIPLGFPFWLILQLPGMNWLGPKIYHRIATNRYTINRFFGVELDANEECPDGVCKLPQ